MPTFEVLVEETPSGSFSVEAASRDEAEEVARCAYDRFRSPRGL